MAKNYAAEKKRLQREIERLSKQAEALSKKERAPIIAGIIRDMKAYAITPDDIAQAFGPKKRESKSTNAAKRTSSGRAKATVQPKFRNPETGETWSGRGRAPRWIVGAEIAGRSRDEFAIEGQATESGMSGDQDRHDTVSSN